MAKEIDFLSRLLGKVDRPYVAVLGGAKVSDKIEVLDALLERVNAIVIGGAMANTFLEAQGKPLGKSKVEKDKLPIARNFLRKAVEKKKTPSTCRWTCCAAPGSTTTSRSRCASIRARATSATIRWRSTSGPARSSCSAGSSTEARTVFWNGPMGVFEKPQWATGHARGRPRARRQQARPDRRRRWRLGGRDRPGRARGQGLARVDRRRGLARVRPGPGAARDRGTEGVAARRPDGAVRSFAGFAHADGRFGGRALLCREPPSYTGSVAAKRLGIFDPSRRLIEDLADAADQADVELISVRGDDDPDLDGLLVPPAMAADLGPRPEHGGVARWIVGDASNAARVAGAAASAGAAGVLLIPVSPAALSSIARSDPTSPELDLARARGLIATSLVDLTGAAAETLRAVAEGFTAHDCIVWWKDGAQMVPTMSRDVPSEGYRAQIAAAARIAAASSGTVVVGGGEPRSVIADALRSTPTEIAGLVAIVSDSARRFSAAERTDLKAIATRLTRELSWLTSHRRIVAEGERLLATSLHDPLSGAMSRGAFEQTITHEVAAAARRNEKLSLVVLDIVGMRRINLEHGHKAGDEVLAQVAARLRATVRGNDSMGRPGGDELAVLLVGASDAQAVLVVRKIIDRIQSEPIKVDDDDVGLGAAARGGHRARDRRAQRRGRAVAVLRRAADRTHRRRPVVARRRDAGHHRRRRRYRLDVGGHHARRHVPRRPRAVARRDGRGLSRRGSRARAARSRSRCCARTSRSDRGLVDRFRAEAGILASLHHKNLVQVYALGEHAGDVYFVMELVEGQPLSEVLRATLERREWFPVEAIAQIALEIGDALDAMHQLGLIHRDVKPANILLDRERDRAVLVDVGVAVKAGDQRDAAGTPGFAAPESFLEQEGGPHDRCLRPGRDAVLPADRPPAVRLRLGAAGDPAPAQRSDATAVQAAPRGVRRRRRRARESTRAEPEEAVVVGLDVRDRPRPRARARRSRVQAAAGSRRPQHRAGRLGLEADPGDRGDLAGDPVARANRDQAGDPRPGTRRAPPRAVAHPPAPRRGIGDGADHDPAPRARRRVRRDSRAARLGRARAISSARSTPRTPCCPARQSPRKVGRGTMSATFARLFGADPSSLAPETVLAALPTFWPRYHDWGEVEVAVHDGSATISLLGYSGSTDVCTLVSAELERIVELTGARAASHHAMCRCTSDAAICEFQLSWFRSTRTAKTPSSQP